MNTALNISKSGLHALQTNLDALSNDIANVNTEGYQAKDISFKELLPESLKNQNVLLSNNAADASIDRGSQSYTQAVNFLQGPLQLDGEPLHLAISGKGFFGVRNQNNELLLTKSGAFHQNQDGSITNDQGNRLEFTRTIPVSEWPPGAVTIDEQGNIFAGNAYQMISVGKIPLFQVNNEESLEAMGANTYRIAPGGVLSSSENSVGDFGAIKQGYLEGSNVNLTKALTDMIVTQRTYSLNAKVLQSSDEMMQAINQFKQ